MRRLADVLEYPRHRLAIHSRCVPVDPTIIAGECVASAAEELRLQALGVANDKVSDVQLKILEFVAKSRFAGVALPELRQATGLGLQQVHYQVMMLIVRGLLVKFTFAVPGKDATSVAYLWLPRFVPDAYSTSKIAEELNRAEGLLEQVPGLTLTCTDVAAMLGWDQQKLQRILLYAQYLNTKTRAPHVFCNLVNAGSFVGDDAGASTGSGAGTRSSAGAGDDDGAAASAVASEAAASAEAEAPITTRIRVISAKLAPAAVTYRSNLGLGNGDTDFAEPISLRRRTYHYHAPNDSTHGKLHACFTLAPPVLPDSVLSTHPRASKHGYAIADALDSAENADWYLYRLSGDRRNIGSDTGSAYRLSSNVVGPVHDEVQSTLHHQPSDSASTLASSSSLTNTSSVPPFSALEYAIDGDYVLEPDFPPEVRSTAARSSVDPAADGAVTSSAGQANEYLTDELSRFNDGSGVDLTAAAAAGVHHGIIAEFGCDHTAYRMILRSGTKGVTSLNLRDHLGWRSKRVNLIQKMMQDANLCVSQVISLNRNNVVHLYADAAAVGGEADTVIDLTSESLLAGDSDATGVATMIIDADAYGGDGAGAGSSSSSIANAAPVTVTTTTSRAVIRALFENPFADSTRAIIKTALARATGAAAVSDAGAQVHLAGSAAGPYRPLDPIAIGAAVYAHMDGRVRLPASVAASSSSASAAGLPAETAAKPADATSGLIPVTPSALDSAGAASDAAAAVLGAAESSSNVTNAAAASDAVAIAIKDAVRKGSKSGTADVLATNATLQQRKQHVLRYLNTHPVTTVMGLRRYLDGINKEMALMTAKVAAAQKAGNDGTSVIDGGAGAASSTVKQPRVPEVDRKTMLRIVELLQAEGHCVHYSVAAGELKSVMSVAMPDQHTVVVVCKPGIERSDPRIKAITMQCADWNERNQYVWAAGNEGKVYVRAMFALLGIPSDGSGTGAGAGAGAVPDAASEAPGAASNEADGLGEATDDGAVLNDGAASTASASAAASTALVNAGVSKPVVAPVNMTVDPSTMMIMGHANEEAAAEAGRGNLLLVLPRPAVGTAAATEAARATERKYQFLSTAEGYGPLVTAIGSEKLQAIAGRSLVFDLDTGAEDERRVAALGTADSIDLLRLEETKPSLDIFRRKDFAPGKFATGVIEVDDDADDGDDGSAAAEGAGEVLEGTEGAAVSPVDAETVVSGRGGRRGRGRGRGKGVRSFRGRGWRGSAASYKAADADADADDGGDEVLDLVASGAPGSSAVAGEVADEPAVSAAGRPMRAAARKVIEKQKRKRARRKSRGSADGDDDVDSDGEYDEGEDGSDGSSEANDDDGDADLDEADDGDDDGDGSVDSDGFVRRRKSSSVRGRGRGRGGRGRGSSASVISGKSGGRTSIGGVSTAAGAQRASRGGRGWRGRQVVGLMDAGAHHDNPLGIIDLQQLQPRGSRSSRGDGDDAAGEEDGDWDGKTTGTGGFGSSSSYSTREKHLRTLIAPDVSDRELMDADEELKGVADALLEDVAETELPYTKPSFASQWQDEVDPSGRTRRRLDWSQDDVKALVAAFVADKVQKERNLQARYYRQKVKYLRFLHVWKRLAEFAERYGLYGKASKSAVDAWAEAGADISSSSAGLSQSGVAASSSSGRIAGAGADKASRTSRKRQAARSSLEPEAAAASLIPDHVDRPEAGDNIDICCGCLQPGDALVCCDKCPRTFCFACLGVTAPPEEDPWHCGQCHKDISQPILKANFAVRLSIPVPLDVIAAHKNGTAADAAGSGSSAAAADGTEARAMASAAEPAAVVDGAGTATASAGDVAPAAFPSAIATIDHDDKTVAAPAEATVASETADSSDAAAAVTNSQRLSISVSLPSGSSLRLYHRDAAEIGPGWWFGREFSRPLPPLLNKATSKWERVGAALGIDEQTASRKIKRLLQYEPGFKQVLLTTLDDARTRNGIKMYMEGLGGFNYGIAPSASGSSRGTSSMDHAAGGGASAAASSAGADTVAADDNMMLDDGGSGEGTAGGADSSLLAVARRAAFNLDPIFLHYTNFAGYSGRPAADDAAASLQLQRWPNMNQFQFAAVTKILITLLAYSDTPDDAAATDGIAESQAGALVLREAVESSLTCGVSIDLQSLFEKLRLMAWVVRLNAHKVGLKILRRRKDLGTSSAGGGVTGSGAGAGAEAALFDEMDDGGDEEADGRSVVTDVTAGTGLTAANAYRGRFEVNKGFWDGLLCHSEFAFDRSTLSTFALGTTAGSQLISTGANVDGGHGGVSSILFTALSRHGAATAPAGSGSTNMVETLDGDAASVGVPSASSNVPGSSTGAIVLTQLPVGADVASVACMLTDNASLRALKIDFEEAERIKADLYATAVKTKREERKRIKKERQRLKLQARLDSIRSGGAAGASTGSGDAEHEGAAANGIQGSNSDEPAGFSTGFGFMDVEEAAEAAVKALVADGDVDIPDADDALIVDGGDDDDNDDEEGTAPSGKRRKTDDDDYEDGAAASSTGGKKGKDEVIGSGGISKLLEKLNELRAAMTAGTAAGADSATNGAATSAAPEPPQKQKTMYGRRKRGREVPEVPLEVTIDSIPLITGAVTASAGLQLAESASASNGAVAPARAGAGADAADGASASSAYIPNALGIRIPPTSQSAAASAAPVGTASAPLPSPTSILPAATPSAASAVWRRDYTLRSAVEAAQSLGPSLASIIACSGNAPTTFSELLGLVPSCGGIAAMRLASAHSIVQEIALRAVVPVIATAAPAHLFSPSSGAASSSSSAASAAGLPADGATHEDLAAQSQQQTQPQQQGAMLRIPTYSGDVLLDSVAGAAAVGAFTLKALTATAASAAPSASSSSSDPSGSECIAGTDRRQLHIWSALQPLAAAAGASSSASSSSAAATALQSINTGLLSIICRHLVSLILQNVAISEFLVLKRTHTCPPGDVRMLLRWLVSLGVLRREASLQSDAPAPPGLSFVIEDVSDGDDDGAPGNNALAASERAYLKSTGISQGAAADLGAVVDLWERCSTLLLPAGRSATPSSSLITASAGGGATALLRHLESFPADVCPIPGLITTYYAQPMCAQLLATLLASLGA